jgi:hypothetical protein
MEIGENLTEWDCRSKFAAVGLLKEPCRKQKNGPGKMPSPSKLAQLRK